jgi:hypothetical protein
VFYQSWVLDLLLDRYAFYTVEAVRSDGSFYLGADVLAHESPFGPATLYLAPGDELVRIFPHNRTFSSRGPLIWHDRPYRRSAENDSVCRTGIIHFGNDFRQEGQRSIAGVPVFRWVRGNGQHGDEEIYLAPSLDCLALKFHNVRYNWFFIPVFIHDLEATSVVWGEPDSVFFAIPVGYRQVEDPVYRSSSSIWSARSSSPQILRSGQSSSELIQRLGKRLWRIPSRTLRGFCGPCRSTNRVSSFV